MVKKFVKRKKCYPLSFPILGGRDLTRSLQYSPFQKYKNVKKCQKITFFSFFSSFFLLNLFAEKEKKGHPLSFPILRGRNSIRALQSSPFQNPGGVVQAWRTKEKKKEVLVSNIWLQLIPLLASLGVWDVHLPPYDSALLMELLEGGDDGGFSVRILLKTVGDTAQVERGGRGRDNHSIPQELVLPGCESPCPLDRFKGERQAFNNPARCLCTQFQFPNSNSKL